MTDIIRLVLKENTVSNKDTKDGETQVFKNVLKGSMGEVEATLTLKAENRLVLEEITSPKLREELFIKIVPNPQTTLDPENIPLKSRQKEEENKEAPKEKSRKKKPKKGNKEGVIDAKYRLIEEQKKIGPGSSDDVLAQIA